MTKWPEGNAIIYCQGAFNTPNGKTAHGLVRFTKRYRILAVIDSNYTGQDAGEVLDGKHKKIPIFSSVEEASRFLNDHGESATHLVIGLAPDGGRLNHSAKQDVKRAIQLGLHVDSGLHDFLTEDSDMVQLAEEHHVVLRDVRKPPPRKQLHFFNGKIEEVKCLKIAVLGTDSAVGKRTTAWLLVQAFEDRGYKAEMVGTGQTAWLQGARYSLMLDSLINDFVTGEIEHAVWSAWKEMQPDVIVIEGQGSLMNPAYPGGFEILAAARPHGVVLQHAPARIEYDGFPGYPIQPLDHQIQAIEVVLGRKVMAITINHENISPDQIENSLKNISKNTSLPAFDVLQTTAQGLADVFMPYIHQSVHISPYKKLKHIFHRKGKRIYDETRSHG